MMSVLLFVSKYPPSRVFPLPDFVAQTMKPLCLKDRQFGHKCRRYFAILYSTKRIHNVVPIFGGRACSTFNGSTKTYSYG